jgi:dipeptidase E
MSTNSDLLLLSNSSVFGRGYLEHAHDAIAEFLGDRKTVHFAPYALADHEAYSGRAGAVFSGFGASVVGLHTRANPKAALEEAEVLFVGGGNSFRLLKALHDHDLIETVRRRVAAGELSYMGSSAGTNMACPSVRTTNDMPIVEPRSFEAFGLIPFQINPHYLDPDPASTHMGETREKRIHQFHEENDVAVLGMREGAWLRREGSTLTLCGTTGARLFSRGRAEEEFTEGADRSFRHDTPARFDSQLAKVDA